MVVFILCLFMISYARKNDELVELKFTQLGNFLIIKNLKEENHKTSSTSYTQLTGLTPNRTTGSEFSSHADDM